MKNNLIDKIVKAANLINNATRNGSGNFMITNPELLDYFTQQEKIRLRKLKLKKILNNK